MTWFLRHAALAAVALIAVLPVSAAEKRYGLTSFEEIEVKADIVVEVVDRSPVRAVATGPQDALDRLVVEARDGKLIVETRQFVGDESRRKPLGPVTLRVNAANLRSAMLAGAGALRIDRLEGQRVTVGLRGPGQVVVGDIDADRLAVTMIGNGTMTLGGAAKQAQMTLSGAGMVDAGELAVDVLVTDSEGAGDHRFHAVDSAAITARGIGRTIVLGDPACTVRNIGSGSVECGAEE